MVPESVCALFGAIVIFMHLMRIDAIFCFLGLLILGVFRDIIMKNGCVLVSAFIEWRSSHYDVYDMPGVIGQYVSVVK